MADQPTTRKNKIPTVRIQQEDTEAVKVVVVEDKDDTSIGLLAAMIFLATLLGTVIGLGADVQDMAATVQDIQAQLNPPPQLCIVGSDTILSAEMASTWEQDFEAMHEVRVRVDAVGSVDGVRAAASGDCVNVLAMSEPMSAQQHNQLTEAGVEIACAAEIGYDVIAFVTNINNPIVSDVRDPEQDGDIRPRRRPVLQRELDQILNGRITNWSEVSNWPDNNPNDRPITIWVRLGSGTTEVVLNRIADFSPTQITPFPFGADYQVCDSNEDCLNRTLETPGSLYWVSVAWMRTQPPGYLKILSILDGDEVSVNPLTEAVDLEEYPRELIRPLYLYSLRTESTDSEVVRLARDFIFYVRGIDGQVALEADSFYNHFSRPIDLTVTFPEPEFSIPESGPRTICKVG